MSFTPAAWKFNSQQYNGGLEIAIPEIAIPEIAIPEIARPDNARPQT